MILNKVQICINYVDGTVGSLRMEEGRGGGRAGSPKEVSESCEFFYYKFSSLYVMMVHLCHPLTQCFLPYTVLIIQKF